MAERVIGVRLVASGAGQVQGETTKAAASVKALNAETAAAGAAAKASGAQAAAGYGQFGTHSGAARKAVSTDAAIMSNSTRAFKNEMAASGSVAQSTSKASISAFSGIKNSISSMSLGAKVGFGALAVGAGLIISETFKGVEKFASLTAEVRSFQRVSQATAEDSSMFAFTFKRLGIDVETGAKAVGMFEKRVAGGKVSLDQYGISIERDNKGHVDMAATLINVSDRFRQIEDPMERAKLGSELFGRSWQTLIPFLSQGHEELQKMFDLADKQGLVFDAQDLEMGKQYSRAVKDLNTSWQGLQVTLGRQVIPEITGLTNGLATVVEQTSKAAGGTNVFRDLVENVLPVSMPFYMAGHAVSSFVDLLHGDLMGAAEQSTRTIPLIGNAIADINPWFDSGGNKAKDWGQAAADAGQKVKDTKPGTDEHRDALKEWSDASFKAAEQERKLGDETESAAARAALAKLNNDAYSSSLKDIATAAQGGTLDLAGFENRIATSIEAYSKAQTAATNYWQAVGSGDPVKIIAAANELALANQTQVLTREQELGIEKHHAARDALIAYRDGLYQALTVLPPNSREAEFLRSKIEALNRQIRDTPDIKPIHFDSNVEEQRYKVLLLQLTMAGLPNPHLTVTADGNPAIVTADGVVFTIDQKTGQVNIDGDIGGATQKTQDAVNWINAQKAAIEVSIKASRALYELGPLAPPTLVVRRWGGVDYMAGGGMRRGRAGIANRPVVMGEPQTGDELYLPRRGDRNRNAQLLQVAAGWQGMGLIPMQAGGVLGGAPAVRPGAAPGALPTGTPGGTEALGMQWAGQLQGAAATVGPQVADSLKQLLEQGVPVLNQFGQQSVASLQQSTGVMNTTWGQSLTQMLQTQTSNLGLMNAETTNQYTMMNAQTGQQLGIWNLQAAQQYGQMQMQTAGTMQNVQSTMALGAAAAADSFVGNLQARIPPLEFTMAGYSGTIKGYGRDFLNAIGVPATFRSGGEFGDPRRAQYAPDDTWRVFAEGGTGGEVYVPKNTDRANALRYLSVGAAWHGARVVPFQDGGVSLEELFFDPAGGPYRIGGHMDHVHAGTILGQRWEMIQAFLVGHGIDAHPTSTTGGSHVGGSLHYQGRAADYGDSVNNVWAVFNALAPLLGGMGVILPTPDVPPPPNFGPGILGNGLSPGMALTMAFSMRQALQKKLEDARAMRMASMMSSAVSSVGGSEEAKAYARSRLAAYGWGEDQWPALEVLWNRESGWNPNARNASSGAAGIPQDITGNMHGGYVGQVDWGLNYIAGRYGSPSAALAFHNAHNWYRHGGMVFDQGGVLPPGPSIVHNDTGRPERLIPAPASGAAAAVSVHVHLGGLEINGLVDSQSAQFDSQVHDLMEQAARDVGMAVKRAIA